MAALLFRKIQSGNNVRNAFSFAAILTIIYGLLRYYIFADLLLQMFDQNLRTMQTQFPSLAASLNPTTISVMKVFMPSGWILLQLVALFVGYLLLLRTLGYNHNLRKFRLPAFMPYLLIAVIPVYFYDRLWFLFVNCLIGLSIVFFFQGLGVLVAKFCQYIPNPVLSTALLVFVLINFLSYIILIILGFADQWLDLRKLETNGGITT